MALFHALRKHYLCHLQFTKETWTQAKKERRNPRNPEAGGNGNTQFWTRTIWRWQLAYVRPKLLQSVKQSDVKLIFTGFHCTLKIHERIKNSQKHGVFSESFPPTEHSTCTVLEKLTLSATYKVHFSAGFEN